MHFFAWTIIAAAVVGLGSTATLQLAAKRQQDSSHRTYQEQDTARAFYSYGYSDDNAARAEYTTRDGASRGFYSYVDADGKLQTVKYEADRRQGFRVEGSNLPQAPLDDKQAPEPVKDTEEVQQARQSHLNALREAEELEARLRKEEEEAERARAQQAQEQERQSAADQRELSAEDQAILERVRAELTAMLEAQQRRKAEQSREQNDAAEKNEAKENENTTKSEKNDDAKATEEAEPEPEPEPERKPADSEAPSNLRTVYTLDDISSSSYLKLADLAPGKLLTLEPQTVRLDDRQLRVPISAYYTLLTPTTKYSVTTPTELRSIRIDAPSGSRTSAGQQPVALSRSLVMHRLNRSKDN